MRAVFVILFIFFYSFISASHAYAAFPAEYDAAADITGKDVGITTKHNKVTVSMERLAKPMHPFDIEFNFLKDNIKSVSYSTNMKMNMGSFKYTPVNLGHGKYRVNLTLPKCRSGDTLWYGALDVVYDTGDKETMYFFYDLK